jgi:DNA-binding response OmpR family regulator
MTVLVVDDQVNVAEVIQDVVEEFGHSCLTARGIDEAEWTLQNVAVDVMVVDLETPGRNPIEWLEDVCLAKPHLARCTVLLSGRDLDPDVMLKIHACGATLLHKPFPIQELCDLILLRLRSKLEVRPGDPTIVGPRLDAPDVSDPKDLKDDA